MKVRETKDNLIKKFHIKPYQLSCKLKLYFSIIRKSGYATALFLSAICTIYFSLSTKFDNNASAMTMKVIPPPNLKSYMIADSTKKRSGIKIKNTGLSPLLIKDIKFYKRNSHTHIENTSYSLGKEFGLDRRRFHLNTIHSKDSLQQGEERWLIKSIINSSASSRKIRNVANNIGIVACYCSIDNICYIKEFGWEVNHKMEC